MTECTLKHSLMGDDSNYNNSEPKTFSVSIRNNDVADVSLRILSTENQIPSNFLLKVMGPLSLEEGKVILWNFIGQSATVWHGCDCPPIVLFASK